MKTLYLVRHAEAVGRKKGLPDFERSLVRKGAKEAKRMARRLVKAGRSPELLVSSPANRAIETAHIFADTMGYDVEKVLLKQEIYDSEDSAGLMQSVTSMQDDCNAIALFGHDPSLSQLASRILSGFDGPVPKAGIVAVTFDVDSWRDIQSQPGRASAFYFPMSRTEKEHALTALRNSLETGLTAHLRDYLSEIGVASGNNVDKGIGKLASRTVAMLFKEMRKKELLQLYWKHAAPEGEETADHETAEA